MKIEELIKNIKSNYNELSKDKNLKKYITNADLIEFENDYNSKSISRWKLMSIILENTISYEELKKLDCFENLPDIFTSYNQLNNEETKKLINESIYYKIYNLIDKKLKNIK